MRQRSSSACGRPSPSRSSSSACSFRACALRSTSRAAWPCSRRPGLVVLGDGRFALGALEDVVYLGKQARAWAKEIGVSLVGQTKIVTAASERARNAGEHGKGGIARFTWISKHGKHGFRMD